MVTHEFGTVAVLSQQTVAVSGGGDAERVHAPHPAQRRRRNRWGARHTGRMAASTTLSRTMIFASAATAELTAAVLAPTAGTAAVWSLTRTATFQIGETTVEVVEGAVALPALLELALADDEFEAAIERWIETAA